MSDECSAYNNVFVMVCATPPDQRSKCNFYCTPFALQFLQSVRDNDGEPIFLPSHGFNPVGRLLGYPLYVVQQIGAPYYGLAFAESALGLGWVNMKLGYP